MPKRDLNVGVVRLSEMPRLRRIFRCISVQQNKNATGIYDFTCSGEGFTPLLPSRKATRPILQIASRLPYSSR